MKHSQNSRGFSLDTSTNNWNGFTEKLSIFLFVGDDFPW